MKGEDEIPWIENNKRAANCHRKKSRPKKVLITQVDTLY